MENRFAGWGVLLFVLFVGGMCAVRDGTPVALPATASQDVFSAERALVDLNAFATAPHPIGSAEHDRVRDYLVGQLTTLGVPPEIQRATGVTPRYQVTGTVENIVARLKGSSGATDAVALVAHYDSVPAGPGAGDDGAGVAALLETLRALRAEPPLRNDALFVITDGEEDGLLGASAFVAENPAAKDVRVVVNFEARGNSGESQMFETSEGNGTLVQMFAQAAPHPDGSSLAYEIYKHMPNDTDMTVFKKAGAAGLNFAFFGHWEAYHTPLDNLQMLNPGSLQHHGENALALARMLGNADLSHLRDRDEVYFSLPENLFVHYSSGLLWPFALGAGVLLFATVFFARGAWQTGVLSIVASLFLHIGLLFVALVIGLGFVLVARWFHLHVLPEGPMDQNVLYTFGLLALLAAVLGALYELFRKKIAPAEFFLGGAFLIFAVLLLTTKWLAGGSYIFFWPFVAGLLATFGAAFRTGRLSILAVILLGILSIPALVLFVPLLKGFFEALGFTSIGAPLLAVTFAVLFLLLYPFLEPVLASAGKILIFVSIAAALVLCIIAGKVTRYTSQHPKPSLLTYVLDADSGKAQWASTVARVDEWTAKYITASPDHAKLPDFAPDWYPYEFLVHEAPVIPLLPPQAALVEDSTDGITRTLRLRITLPRHARTVHVGVGPSEVLSASANGHALGNPAEARWYRPGRWGFDYVNPGDAMDLQLQLQGTKKVTVVLVDRASGIPLINNTNPPPRPYDSMPIHSGDQTMVRRSYVF